MDNEPAELNYGPYVGMTVNERLANAGLVDLFDQAIADGSREAVVKILLDVDLTQSMANRIVEAKLGRQGAP